MKLLFDENISFRIVKKIIAFFPESKQVSDIDLVEKSDFIIWDYAKTNNFTIITHDKDYIDIVILKGHPPKIILLKTGNTSTQIIAQILIYKESLIREFISDKNESYLVIQ